MELKDYIAIYGDSLPSMEEFFSDGKHSTSTKALAKQYGARRVHLIWDIFVKDYKDAVSKGSTDKPKAPAAKAPAKAPAAKAPAKEKANG